MAEYKPPHIADTIADASDALHPSVAHELYLGSSSFDIPDEADLRQRADAMEASRLPNVLIGGAWAKLELAQFVGGRGDLADAAHLIDAAVGQTEAAEEILDEAYVHNASYMKLLYRARMFAAYAAYYKRDLSWLSTGFARPMENEERWHIGEHVAEPLVSDINIVFQDSDGESPMGAGRGVVQDLGQIRRELYVLQLLNRVPGIVALPASDRQRHGSSADKQGRFEVLACLASGETLPIRINQLNPNRPDPFPVKLDPRIFLLPITARSRQQDRAFEIMRLEREHPNNRSNMQVLNSFASPLALEVLRKGKRKAASYLLGKTIELGE